MAGIIRSGEVHDRANRFLRGVERVGGVTPFQYTWEQHGWLARIALGQQIRLLVVSAHKAGRKGPNLAKGDFLAKDSCSAVQSGEKSSRYTARTHKILLWVTKKYAQWADCAVLSPPETQPPAKPQWDRSKMRSRMGKRTFGVCFSLIKESLSVYLATFWGFARLGPFFETEAGESTP